MTGDTKHVFHHALRLPLAERAQLISELIASLDGAPDADAESAWAVEIEQRVARARAGLTTGTDWEALKANMMRKHFPGG